MAGKIDNHRILCIHADPASASVAEIQSIAEIAHEHQRTRQQECLRDRFAMAALTATLPRWEDAKNTPIRIAERSYEIADAMLEARG